MNPKTTVVLITCNRLELLKERSLPSVQNQTDANFECIVVDDNSNDGTEQFMKEICEQDERIRYVKHETNRGASAGRNTGVRLARGEFIAFLDDDDAFLPKFLEVAVPVLQGLPERCGAVSVGRFVLYPMGRIYFVPHVQPGSFYVTIDDGWLMRKAIFTVISWDEDLFHDDDTAMGIEFFKRYKSYGIDTPLFLKYTYRTVGKKIYSSFGIPSERRLRGLDNFVKKYYSFFEKTGNKDEFAYIARYIGKTYCIGGKMTSGLPFLRTALHIKPGLKNLANVAAAYCGHYPYRLYWKMEVFLSQLWSMRK